MTDLLQRGAGRLAAMLKKSASRPVSYHRGTEACPLRATVGTTVFEQVNSVGAIVRFESKDFVVTAGDLNLPQTGATLPAAGDRIREAMDGTTYVYEVMAPGEEPCYQLDRTRTLLRIHTKQVDTL